MMMNPKTTAKQVGQLISSDPALTVKILKVVNSAFYGFPSRITTVTHAIVILGFNTVKSIVLSTSIFDLFEHGRNGGLDPLAFWQHSVGTAAASKVVARMSGYAAQEDFFVAGLLHDSGKLILGQFLPQDMHKVVSTVQAKDCLFLEAEREVMEVDHADIGSVLFEQWKLSKGLVQAVAYHHNPPLAGDALKITSVIHVADILCRTLQFGSGGDRRLPEISPTAWKALGLKGEPFEQMLEETDREIEKAKVFLDFVS
jgi:HD-like signal output (HDOD) protein